MAVGRRYRRIQLSQQLSPSELSLLVADWRDRCAAAVRPSKGLLNKQIGDGLLFYWSYWFNERADPHSIVQALDALSGIQAVRSPSFRICLHHVQPGEVSIERCGASDELIGPQVNFVFRMDDVAKELSVALLLTAAAVARLGVGNRVEDLGSFPVADFSGTFQFFRWTEPRAL
jgi:class 3 adenylate cyclase